MPRTSPELPELVSIPGAAAILGYSKQYVHRLADRGQLVGTRIDGNGGWAFVKKYVEEYAKMLKGATEDDR
ncbi:helix-turn-helix domain-containing protein [Glycomyces artemisiae]|uniref:Helix-turn-helix domain-containing protein n=1 Tax=Glycomyces artemisiae TaxID=1076443 RepID=A0A2T0UEN4_9ACTN|nr:helix-turn-helix domain-containing protein [Glycomyces artemisiae]PRY56405.1 hypothetical protein B0I28_10954 [Glycomyces artemisiae]